jgi:hypothetical protein
MSTLSTPPEEEQIEYAEGPTATVRRRRRRRRKPPSPSSSTTTATSTATATAAAAVAVVSASSSSGGVESVLRKLKESVSGGDLYTALQVYKALFARFAKRGEVAEATELAARGACLLLSCGLTRAGTDLAKQLVELLSDTRTPATDANTAHLLAIVRAYPTHPEAVAAAAAAVAASSSSKSVIVDDTCDEDMKAFLVVALEWSSAYGEYPRGHPKLNAEAARQYKRTGDTFNACLRYLFAEQCGEHARYVFDLASGGGYRSERDLFLARAVLQLLAVENLRDAVIFHDTFHGLMASDGGSRLETPLVNFVQLLLDVCKRSKEALPLFQLLQARYAKSLARDPALAPCMARIATKFFGVAPPKKGGMLGMLESLLGGPKKR